MSGEALLSSQMSGLIPETISNEIINQVKQNSFCLANSKREPMTTVKKTIPVLASLPGPTWVSEGKKINVVKPTIVPVTLTAKKIGFILTASRETLNDTVLNTFMQLRPSIVDAFSIAIDKAIIAGDTIDGTTTKVFPTTILETAAKQKVERTTGTIADDIADALTLVENNNYNATNILAINSIKNELRKQKTTTGEYLYTNTNELFGVPMNYTNKFNSTTGYAVVGNFREYLLTGIYQSITYDVLREATLDLGDSKTINLAQEDLCGIRVTMRVASNILREDAFAMVTTKAQEQH